MFLKGTDKILLKLCTNQIDYSIDLRPRLSTSYIVSKVWRTSKTFLEHFRHFYAKIRDGDVNLIASKLPWSSFLNRWNRFVAKIYKIARQSFVLFQTFLLANSMKYLLRLVPDKYVKWNFLKKIEIEILLYKYI